jgi:hypothetical protein
MNGKNFAQKRSNGSKQRSQLEVMPEHLREEQKNKCF